MLEDRTEQTAGLASMVPTTPDPDGPYADFRPTPKSQMGSLLKLLSDLCIRATRVRPCQLELLAPVLFSGHLPPL